MRLTSIVFNLLQAMRLQQFCGYSGTYEHAYCMIVTLLAREDERVEL